MFRDDGGDLASASSGALRESRRWALAPAAAYGPRTPGGICWTNGPNLTNFGAYRGIQVVFAPSRTIVPLIRMSGSSGQCSPRSDLFQFEVGERHCFRIAGRCGHCGLLIGIHRDGYEVHFHPGEVATYPHRP